MGMVVMTYKVNPDSDLEDVDTDAIAETIATLRDDNYDCLLYTSPSPRDSR